MFFLKELPTQAMLDKYTSDLSGHEKKSITDALSIMRKASLLVRSIERFFSANDLSQLRFLVLIVIDREPDRTSLYAHEIASRLDVSRPVLTRAIKRLIDDGLLTSINDEIDKRAKKITLTEKGVTCLSGVLPGYFNEINKLMD
ncbi:MarR family transcriptional regulator [Gammaproteobacteria bacterium AS21]